MVILLVFTLQGGIIQHRTLSTAAPYTHPSVAVSQHHETNQKMVYQDVRIALSGKALSIT
jgi:hypothetical protein